ncbi:MAG: nitroreductase [Candidatus Azotimanducaceae bacterium]|jgi:nitroreductase
MQVSDAVKQRSSIRAFTEKAVSTEQLQDLITQAARAPSGGNVQPWRIYLLNGDAMARFKSYSKTSTAPESPAYDIYPAGLTEPYRSSRFKVGEDMYALLGISREDRGKRIARLMENYQFFGAPAGFFCFVDRQMGPPQWSDLGMYLQTFMLLAEEAGLATCAQEAWAARPETVDGFIKPPEELMLFCGMAIGYKDDTAAVNKLVSDRAEFNDFATIVE